jgi:HYR domain
LRRLQSALAAIATTAAALVLVTTAGADDVSSAPNSVTITAGGPAATIAVSIAATDDDGHSGCNVDSQNPATVTFTAAAPVVATAALTFQNCHQSKDVTVSAPASAEAGDYTIAVAASGGLGGTYNVSPSSIAVHVDAAPPQQTDTTPPDLSLPANFTVEATSASGAVATFTASASDNGQTVAVSCNPPSGSTFGFGATTVTCSATDASNNTATGTFQITVQDTTGPALTLPAGITADATSPAGGTVNFDATATDAVDGTRPVNCSPASGSTFAPGATTVSCTSVDSRNNQSSGSFTITVNVTNAPPSVVVPPDQVVEANGPSGSTVTYTPPPTASDTVDGPLAVTCVPASGSLFPLGTTPVICTSAADSFGASTEASFNVSVVDRTPPTLTVPPDATFVSDNGGPLPRSALAAYLARGRAEDAVDPQPTLIVNMPDFFPLGVTEVRYSAADASGNVSTGTTRITIILPPPPGTPRPTPPPDDPPPARVTNVRVVPGNGTLRLTWRPPADADVARYAAFRSERGGPEVQVYNGASPSFTDRGLINGVEYRYVIVAYDRAGHRSVGVAVAGVPRRPMLLRPQDRARVRAGQVFTWRAVSSARYYNFQLFRVLRSGGVERLQKVMSAWPVANRFRLQASWRFEGRRYRLVAGTYRWFVWPGFGVRADARYGVVLGERTFTVAPRR